MSHTALLPAHAVHPILAGNAPASPAREHSIQVSENGYNAGGGLQKSNRIHLSQANRMSQKIRDAIAKYDTDGDGTLDMDEVSVSGGHFIGLRRCHHGYKVLHATKHLNLHLVI